MQGLTDVPKGAPKKQQPIVKAGAYIGKCYSIIQLGTHEKDFQGTKTMTKLIHLSFELPTEKAIFDQAKGEQPMAVFQEFTLSVNETKSNFAKFLKSWRGMVSLPAKVNVREWLDKPCIINIVHQKGKQAVLPLGESIYGDGMMVYPKISSVSPLMAGQVCPATINPVAFIEFSNLDIPTFMSIPKWIREKIRKSQEWPELLAMYPGIDQEPTPAAVPAQQTYQNQGAGAQAPYPPMQQNQRVTGSESQGWGQGHTPSSDAPAF